MHEIKSFIAKEMMRLNYTDDNIVFLIYNKLNDDSSQKFYFLIPNTTIKHEDISKNSFKNISKSSILELFRNLQQISRDLPSFNEEFKYTCGY